MENTERITILAVPYDASVTHRSGASGGPSAILKSVWKGLPGGVFTNHEGRYWATTPKDVTYYPEWCPPTGDVRELTDSLRQAVEKMSSTAFPVVLGGEHSVTAGSFLGACSAVNSEVLLLIFDAHVDCWDCESGNQHNHSTFLRYLIEEKGVPGKNIVVIGARGLVPGSILQGALELGITVFGISQVRERGMRVLVEEVLAAYPNHKVYLSLDIDSLDPCFAPGTGTPEWGGLTPTDLFTAIELLCRKCSLIGFDLVEVAPGLDRSQVTQYLAAELLWRFLLLLNAAEAPRLEGAR